MARYLIYSQNIDLTKITNKSNKIEPTIDFTYEVETNATLIFLDALLTNNNNKLEFDVYHKFTDKNDHINFSQYQNIKWNNQRILP